MMNTGRRGPRDHDTPEAYQAVLPSQGGITNARGLAGMYRPLAVGGEHDGVRLVGPDDIARMAAVSSATAIDAVLLTGMRFSLGFMKSTDNRRARARCSGQPDPVGSRVRPRRHGRIAWVRRPGGEAVVRLRHDQARPSVLLNERGQRLVDAVYRSLGCGSICGDVGLNLVPSVICTSSGSNRSVSDGFLNRVRSFDSCRGHSR